MANESKKNVKQSPASSTAAQTPGAEGRTRRARREAKRVAKAQRKRATMTPRGTARKILRAKVAWGRVQELRSNREIAMNRWQEEMRALDNDPKALSLFLAHNKRPSDKPVVWQKFV